MHGELPLRVTIDGVDREAHSSYAFAGAFVLTISTVLPDRALAFELISTYIGTYGVPAHAVHLSLGPIGHASSAEHVEHSGDRLAPAVDPRACAYDHAQRLIDRLTGLGFRSGVVVDEDTFAQLERVE